MTTVTATVDRQFRDEKREAPFSKAHALRLEFKQIIEREYHLEQRAANQVISQAAGQAQAWR